MKDNIDTFDIVKDMLFANIALTRIALILSVIEEEFIMNQIIIFVNKIVKVNCRVVHNST